MKIRTISIGVRGLPDREVIGRIGGMLSDAAARLERHGFEVQTRRIALEHWKHGIGGLTPAARREFFASVDAACAEANLDFCSVGTASEPGHVEEIAAIISSSRRLNGSAQIGSTEDGIHRDSIRAAAQAILDIAGAGGDGFGNFRFGAGSCVPAGTPFFPGAYHDGTATSFSIGLENSDLLVAAFHGCGTLETATRRLEELLNGSFQRVARAAEDVSAATGLPLRGFDTSIASSLAPEDSVVLAFESVGVDFGGTGTLAVCGAITSVIKRVAVPRVGYCGLMLPVLEDVGLARASTAQQFDITDLIAYSSVCAVGVDMVAVPGDVSLASLERLLLDVATVSVKAGKPLLVRVLPVAGRRAGDPAGLRSPYVCDGTVMKL